MKKRFTAILLTVLMLLAVLPMHASSAVSDSAYRVSYTFVPHAVGYDIDASCVYADAFFRADPAVYNPTLSHLSLAFALTCGTSRTSTDANGNWDPIGASAHAESFLCGTRGASKLGIVNLGFSDFARSADLSAGEPTTDTIGAIAAHKTVYENGENYTLIALGIRGLRYGDEGADNFNVGSEGDHRGFSAASDRVIAFLDDYIDTYLSDAGKLKLWITGYSRSAIIANMTAAAVYDGALTLPRGVSVDPASDMYCYTFATPRGVLLENAKPWSNIFNVISDYDIVPAVAPEAWGFTRHGVDVILPTHENSGSFSRHHDSMQTYLDSILGDGTQTVHTPQTVSVMQSIKIRLDRLFTDPSNIIDIEYADESTADALKNGFDWFFSSVFSSRAEYAEIEDELLTLLGPDAPQDISFEGMLASIMTSAEELFTDRSTLISLLTPLLLQHLDNSDSSFYRTEAEARFADIFGMFLSSLEQNTGTSLRDTAWETLLYTILYKTLDRASYEIAHDHYRPIGQLLGGMTFVMESGLAAHFPEVSLAWVRALDPAVIAQSGEDDRKLMSVYYGLLAGPLTAEERLSNYRGMAISGLLHDYPMSE